MEAAAFCTVVSTILSITPNRSQMFQYESLWLSCEVQGYYTMKRNSVNGGICSTDCPTCSTDWGKRINTSHCVIPDLYPQDTGVYWCESGQGACSDAVNITVTEGNVILESPVLPVTEGSDVTLRCCYTNKTTGKPSSDLPAYFYKDGSLVRTESTGQMTIHTVYKSDEGFYKCNISDLRESPESWMDVRGNQWGHPSSTGPTPSIPIHLVIRSSVCVLVVFVLVLVSVFYNRKYKGLKLKGVNQQAGSGRHLSD